MYTRQIIDEDEWLPISGIDCTELRETEDQIEKEEDKDD